ncbi:MAG: class III extradiol ring-cleavage dioxygenase [Pseudomonadota bacterium]|nr:class III extradiol ring-cleavage dioxygenase [Pseudomonadota bacterium]
MANHPTALFVSHGGGPLPLLGDASHQEMVEALAALADELERPAAVLVVSAHWESRTPRITASKTTSLLYDYHGFPEASYRIQYPCPAAPELARSVQQCLADAGLGAELDTERGLDHGVFVPLKLLFPRADVPCLQVSLIQSLDPNVHLAMGRALRQLQQDGLLILGSGFSFHNMREFFSPATPEVEAMNQAFEGWLQDTCCNPEHTAEERLARLRHWTRAPHARFCHPREEHLLPLHVCMGAVAGAACPQPRSLRILNKQASLFLWPGG